PDDGVGGRIEPDSPTDDRPLTAELPLPEPMAQNHYGCLFLRRREQAPDHWLGPDDAKELRRRLADEQLLRIAETGGGRLPEGESRERLDQAAALAPFEQTRIRREAAIEALTGIGDPDHRDAVRVTVRKRLDQQELRNAEDGARQADSQGKRPNRRDGE